LKSVLFISSILLGILFFSVSLNDSFATHFPIVGKIGETVQASTGVVYVEEMKTDTTAEGAKIISITFTFKNSEEGGWSLALGNWKLVDDKGNIHDPLRESYPITPLAKGDISRGYFKFVIGENVNPSVLALRESVNFDSEINIDLTKTASPIEPIPTSDLLTCHKDGITNGDFEMTILNQRVIQTNPFIYDIELSLKNISEKTKSLTDYELKDERGNLAEHDFRNSNFDGREIFPSQSVTGNIAFTFDTAPKKVIFIGYEASSHPLVLHTGYCPVSKITPKTIQETAPQENDSSFTSEISSDTQKIPAWIKNNAKWWGEGQIDDSEFISGIQHLMTEKIIDIPNLPKQASDTAKESIPDWVRNNAKWWADGVISEDDFVNGIKYLVENSIIRIK